MTTTSPLTPEEIAEARRLGGQIAPRAEFRDWLWANAYRLLGDAERLAEVERALDLAETPCRPEYITDPVARRYFNEGRKDAVQIIRDAMLQPKEPEHE